jgi:hypothetical protein
LWGGGGEGGQCGKVTLPQVGIRQSHPLLAHNFYSFYQVEQFTFILKKYTNILVLQTFKKSAKIFML